MSFTVLNSYISLQLFNIVCVTKVMKYKTVFDNDILKKSLNNFNYHEFLNLHIYYKHF